MTYLQENNCSDHYEKALGKLLATGVTPPVAQLAHGTGAMSAEDANGTWGTYQPYLGLFDTNNPRAFTQVWVDNFDDDNSGGGVEVTGANYARVAANFLHYEELGWVGGRVLQNWYVTQADIVFPTAGAGGWGDVAGWAIFDSLTAGNVVFYGAFPSTVTVGAGAVFTVPGSAPTGHPSHPSAEPFGISVCVK
jgi:hypothetical protein